MNPLIIKPGLLDNYEAPVRYPAPHTPSTRSASWLSFASAIRNILIAFPIAITFWSCYRTRPSA
ncbi:MAG: hypothetical protein GPOALKHO_001023 [Sodalis sp.]|nr:MAG: hypothetical protein GPOALKHO_001023 [Sodalis sp.]